MGADAVSLPCPICLHTGVFKTAQCLKDRLIYVSTNKLMCPVCQEEVSGLDKLTIHLFSHVKLISTEANSKNDIGDTNTKSQQKVHNVMGSERQKKAKISTAKNKAALSTPNTQVKFVKIYPKLPVIALNTVPILDISPTSDGCSQKNSTLYIPAVKSENTTLRNNNKCNICGLHFVDAEILKMHNCLIHNIEDNVQPTITRYDCHLCSKNFKMRGSLMVHLRVAHFGFTSNNKVNLNDSCSKELNGNNTLEDKSIIDLEIHDGKQWQCDVCRKCFTTKYFLKKHKRLHTGETPYACTQCNKTFTFQQSYHKHLLYHNDEKPHTCNFCGRAFKELSTLHNHQRIHTGEKPFACETCGKCFRQRVSYLVHRRIHTGAMPYKCTACEKSFRYKVSQRTHKCQAQPPGTVVRKTGDLVEKLKKKQVLEVSSTRPNFLHSQSNIIYPEVSEINAELVRTGAQLSLEDMESDNFNIISEAFCENSRTLCSTYPPVLTGNVASEENNTNIYKPNIDELIDSIPANNKSIPSPSDIFKNLCLSHEEDSSNEHQFSQSNNYDINKEFNIYL